MRRGARAAIAVAAGLAVGATGYWLAGGPLVALHLAAVYGLLAWMWTGHHETVPAADEWVVGRWNALLGALGGIGVLPFVSSSFGLSLWEGMSLAALAFGLAGITFLVGCVMTSEAARTAGEETARGETGDRPADGSL